MTKVCVFDAYGTLFDVHAATRHHVDELGDAAGAISQLWRQKQLEYTWLRSLMGRYVDFWQVTADALDYSLDSHGVEQPTTRQKLLDAYLQLDSYDEVAEALETLRDNGVRSAILSNGSPDMLASAVANAGLSDLLEAVLSVDSLGIFKPDPRVYQQAIDHFDVAPTDVSFQSSNAWDISGAASFGLGTVWVNRFGQPRERLDHGPAVEITTLRELPAIVLE